MNLLRLVRKDFRTHAGFVLLLVALALAAFGVFVKQLPAAAMPGAALLLNGLGLMAGFLICFRTMVAEEKNRAFLFLKSLPIATHEMVVAKFVVNLVFATLAMGALFCAYWLMRSQGILGGAPALTVGGVLLGLGAQWLNNTFFLTIAFVFDSEKAVWVPFPFLFLAINLMLNLDKLRQWVPLDGLLRMLAEQQLVVALLALATCGGFAWISTYALNRKQVFR